MKIVSFESVNTTTNCEWRTRKRVVSIASRWTIRLSWVLGMLSPIHLASWVVYVSIHTVGCASQREHTEPIPAKIDWDAEMQLLASADTSEKQIEVLKKIMALQTNAISRSIPVPAWVRIPLDANGKGFKDLKAYGDIKFYLIMDARPDPAFPPLKIQVFGPTSQSYISGVLRRLRM